MQNCNTTKAQILLPQGVMDRVREVAAAEGLSISGWVRRLILMELASR